MTPVGEISTADRKAAKHRQMAERRAQKKINRRDRRRRKTERRRKLLLDMRDWVLVENES